MQQQQKIQRQKANQVLSYQDFEDAVLQLCQIFILTPAEKSIIQSHYMKGKRVIETSQQLVAFIKQQTIEDSL